MSAKILQFPLQPRIAARDAVRPYYFQDFGQLDPLEFTPSTEPHVTDFIGDGEIADLIDGMLRRNDLP